MKPDRKVARVYIRKSQLRPGEEAESPEAQLEEGRKWCARNDYWLDEEASVRHADLDVSGFFKAWDERPGSLAHYEAAKKGAYATLLVFKLDRFGRDQADTLYGLKQFMRTGVDVRSLVENYDPATDEGFIMRSVLTMVAEMESRNTSKRVLASVELRAKVLKRHHGGRPPMWLRRTGKGTFEVIEEIAEVVRYMIGLRLKGLSYVAIARAMNDAELKTISGLQWHRSMVAKYLAPSWIHSMAGTAYTRRAGRYKTDRVTGRRVSRGEPIALPGVYPRIIDEETEQNILAMQVVHRQDPSVTLDYNGSASRYSGKGSYLLSGLVFCEHCRGVMMGHMREDKERGRIRRSYYCYNATLRTEGIYHTKKIVDGGLLEEAVFRAVDPVVLQAMAAHAAVANSEPPRRFRRTASQIQDETDRLVSLVGRGLLKEEDFDRRYKVLQAELADLDYMPIKPPEPTLMASQLKGDGLSRVEQRALLRRLIRKVEYPLYITNLQNTSRGRNLGTLRPCARVWVVDGQGVEWPIVVPLYRAEYEGPRLRFLLVDGKVSVLNYGADFKGCPETKEDKWCGNRSCLAGGCRKKLEPSGIGSSDFDPLGCGKTSSEGR